MMLEHVLIGVAEEPAGARRGIADPIARYGLHHLARGLNDRARGEVLAGAARGLLGRTGSSSW